MKTYNTWDEFDTTEYGWRCYGRRIMDVDRAIIAKVIEAIEQIGIKPESVHHAADIGTGPNMFPALLVAPFIAPKEQGGTLELIEPGAPNRRYIQSVLDGSDEQTQLGGIWDKYEMLMASYSPVWRGALSKTKQIARVRRGSVYDLPADTFDLITSYAVAESITDSREECERAIDAMIAAVKPGGLVIMAHTLESTGWYAGEGTQFPATPITIEDVHKMYGDKLNNLTVIHSPSEGEVRPGYHGSVAVVGTRRAPATAVAALGSARSGVEKPFTHYDTQSCLYDQQRVEYLSHAIYSVVKPGDIVIDGGSGTGVLGMLAAKAGAAKVYCVEMNPETGRILQQNALNNGMQDIIEVIIADATTVQLPEQADVIVAEVISCGFFYEPQLQIIENLKRFLKPGGAIIPGAITHNVELIDAQENLYGLRLDYDARYHPLKDTTCTTRGRYLATDFLQPTSFNIDAVARVRCRKSGRVNAVKITYSIQFSDSTLATEPTEFLLVPQIVFLPEPVWLKQGDYYNVNLKYTASCSPLECALSVWPLGSRP